MAQMAISEDDLKGFNIVDVHVHVGPELGSRRYHMLSLAEELKRFNMKAVIKNHFFSTTPLASLARSQGYRNILGSVTLNHGVGGVHSEAIRAAISGNKSQVKADSPSRDPIVVWMPSIHSRAHLEMWGHDLLPEWGVDPTYVKKRYEISPCHVVGESGRVRDEVHRVLNLIARKDLILATGHLAREEIFLLVPLAVTQGVRRIIITHPFYKVTAMSIDEQKELVDMHARLVGGRRDSEEYQLYLEYTYTGKTIDGISFEKDYKKGIDKIGSGHIILSSDAGQVRWPEWKNSEKTGKTVDAKPVYECWQEFMKELKDLGITDDQIRQMASESPSRLLGIA